MGRKDFIKLISFVSYVSHIKHYNDLLEELESNKCNISVNKMMEEIKGIAELFKIWLEEYTWSIEDVNYMQYVINISK